MQLNDFSFSGGFRMLSQIIHSRIDSIFIALNIDLLHKYIECEGEIDFIGVFRYTALTCVFFLTNKWNCVLLNDRIGTQITFLTDLTISHTSKSKCNINYIFNF